MELPFEAPERSFFIVDNLDKPGEKEKYTIFSRGVRFTSEWGSTRLEWTDIFLASCYLYHQIEAEWRTIWHDLIEIYLDSEGDWVMCCGDHHAFLAGEIFELAAQASAYLKPRLFNGTS